jgi:hypothetical protein
MESIETLNTRLKDHFGTDISSDRPIFRIVWANDETEWRRVTDTEEGIVLLFPEVKLCKKYPYMKDLYVLERLVIIPEFQQAELPTSKMSYEPLWAYCDAVRNPLPPVWNATKLVIDSLYAALGKTSLVKYVDSEKNTTPEGRDQRISEMQMELFGDETEVGDALRYKEGIVVPSNYNKVTQ